MKYEMTAPVVITPRLLPGVKIGDAWISITYSDKQENGRVRYKYYIDLPKRHRLKAQSYTNDDLWSGGFGGGLQGGLSSLLTFLNACGEGMAYQGRTGGISENADLFPRFVANWAMYHTDELGSLAIELKETPNLIKEVAE